MRRNVSTRLSGPALRTRVSYQRKFSLLFGNGPATNHGFPHFWRYGAPERIRTSGLCLRRAALYPAELRVLDRPRPPGSTRLAKAAEPRPSERARCRNHTPGRPHDWKQPESGKGVEV